MSISSLPVAKFQFPWAREEERDPREQKQIAALTAALQPPWRAKVHRGKPTPNFYSVNIHWRLSSSTGSPTGYNGSQPSFHCKVGPRPRKRRRNWQLRLVVLRRLAACIVGFTCSIVRKLSNSINISDFCAATSPTFYSKMRRMTIRLR